MDFLPAFGFIFIGIVIGWKAREYHAIQTINKILEEAEGDHLEEEADTNKPTSPMYLEKHNGVLFAFLEADGSFLGQGKDLYELDESIQVRFPDRKFTIQEKNLEEIGVERP